MDREAARKATVAVLTAVRYEYLRGGANPLKHWDQIQDRMRAAARTSVSVPEWVTALARGLQLGAPDEVRTTAIARLDEAVGGEAREWLDLVESEHAYLIALTRLRAQEAKAEREELESKLDEAFDSNGEEGS